MHILTSRLCRDSALHSRRAAKGGKINAEEFYQTHTRRARCDMPAAEVVKISNAHRSGDGIDW